MEKKNVIARVKTLPLFRFVKYKEIYVVLKLFVYNLQIQNVNSNL